MELIHNDDKSRFSSAPWDLVLMFVLVGIVVLISFWPAFGMSAFGLAAAIVFLSFVPGYALVAAFFPRTDDLQTTERVAYAIVLSVIIVPLIGFCLNYTRFGIVRQSIVGVTSAFVVACLAIAYYRRTKLDVDERFVVGVAALKRIKSLSLPLPASRLTKGLIALLVATSILSAAAIGYTILDPTQREAFTEFYILEPNGTLPEYPSTFQVGQQQNITVGITNHEYQDVTYGLVVVAENATNSSQKTLIYNESITVPNTYTSEQPVALKFSEPGNNTKVDFLLYRDNDTQTPYREASLWVNVTNSST